VLDAETALGVTAREVDGDVVAGARSRAADRPKMSAASSISVISKPPSPGLLKK